MSTHGEVSARYIKGVGPKRALLLEGLGIRTAEDILYHFPRDYIDRSAVVPIGEADIGSIVTIKAAVVSRRKRRLKGRSSLVEVKLDDGTGTVHAAWFNQPYIFNAFKKGDIVLAYGKITMFDKPQMVNPEYDTVQDEGGKTIHAERIVPVYPLTQGITQKVFRQVVHNTLESFASLVPDMFGQRHVQTRGLPPIQRALRDIHFPRSWSLAQRARKRLVYDELFILETGMALRRRGIRGSPTGIQFSTNKRIDARIRRLFPFRLTRNQEKAVAAIIKDMCSSYSMNRLLQGEVGSGKTVVALYAMLTAVAGGWQVALMAPTEILAEQHFRTISAMLRGSKVRIDLLLGGRSKEKKEKLERAARGETDIMIGTHALIEGDIEFKNLGLVVVDEQHKFGVLQRAKLRAKAADPDVLVMTATPIPRTLALTIFGDLDVTTIRELPAGRRGVVTRIVSKSQRYRAYEFIRDQLASGRQAFFVCPLVEESEKLDAKSAEETYERLKDDVFPEFKLALLHGRMKSEEKDTVMHAFAAGKFDILVATVVVEVGIDIPNAAVMAIENAERFGLSQLHQLRGRIGRGKHRSYCLLFAGSAGDEAMERLNVIASTSDGFRIAEEDLRLRGTGEFFGTRQHGIPELTIADLGRDFDILKLARRDAFGMVRSDPKLGTQGHRVIAGRVREKFKGRLDLINVG